MQRGPLLQPVRSTERVLSGPPRAHPSGCVQPFRLRRAQPASARALARRRASMASTFSLVPLHRRSKPTRWAGFPLGVCSAKASLLSQGEAPRKRPASPFGEYASPLFPKAVTVSCLLLRRGRNRASPAFQPISVVGCFTPEPSPTKTRARNTGQGFSLGPALPFTQTAFPQRRIFFNAHGDSAVSLGHLTPDR